MKKLFSLLLALALAAGLATPAMAAGEDVPVITVQPQNVHAVPGEQFTISVEAYIPNGDTVGYWWMDARTNSNLGNLGPELTRTAGDPVRGEYYCRVYNATKDFTPQTARSVNSDRATVSHTPLTAEETPVITAQPQGPGSIPPGIYFALTVAASIPNGDAVGYQWYELRSNGNVHTLGGRTEPTLNTWLRDEGTGGVFTYYCVVYNADKGVAAGSVTSAHVVVINRLATAKELKEEYQKLLDNQPPFWERIEADAFHLVNGAFDYTLIYMSIWKFWTFDLLGVRPEALPAVSLPFEIVTSPLILLPGIFAFFAWPFSLLLAAIAIGR